MLPKVSALQIQQISRKQDTSMHAATMLESKDVVHNPQLTAYWKKQQQDAYYGNLNLAAQSADATKFQADMWSSVAKDPTKFKDYDQLDQTNKMYENSSVATLKKMGLNTALPDAQLMPILQRTLISMC